MNDPIKKLYRSIQDSIPITRSEINIALLILAAVSINIAYGLINGIGLSESEKKEILLTIDSLKQNKKLVISNPKNFEHIPRDKNGKILKVDPNIASKNELMLLKGVGKKTAQVIIDSRNSGLVFLDTTDLLQVKGIGPKTLQKFKHQLVFKRSITSNISNDDQQTTQTSKIDINTASVIELESLPGIGKSTAQKIIDYRNTHPFKSIHDLIKVKGIGNKKFDKLKEFIEVRLL